MKTFMFKSEPFNKQIDNGEHRKENVLCAVLALIKELDYSELEFIKRDIDRKLGYLIVFFSNKQMFSFRILCCRCWKAPKTS